MSNFVSLLVENQIVSITDVERTLQRQVIRGGDISTNLLEMGVANEEVLTRFLAQDIGLDPVQARKLDGIPLEVLSVVPEELVRNFRILPYEMDDSHLGMAVDAAPAAEALAQVGFILGLKVVPAIALPYRLSLALARNYGLAVTARFVALAQKLDPGFDPNAPPRILAYKVRSGVITGTDPRREAIRQASGAGVTSGRIVSLDEEKPIREERPSVDSSCPSTVPPRPSAPAPPLLLSFDEALVRLESADDRQAILSTALLYSQRWFSFSALFVIQDREAQGWRSVHAAGKERSIEEIAIRLGESGFFAQAASGALAVGPPRKEPNDIEALKRMKRKPRAFLVAPVLVRSKPVLLLYGDNGREAIDGNAAADLAAFLAKVTDAVERLIRRRKVGSASRPASLLSEKAIPIKAGHPSALAAAMDSARRRSMEKTPPPPADYQHLLHESREPSLLAMGRGTDAADRPEEAPAPQPSGTAGDERRPAVVSEPVEVSKLVEVLVGSVPPDEAVVAAAVAAGDAILPDLARRFPGPLLCDRYQHQKSLPPVSDIGPVLKVIVRLGLKALPVLLPLLESFDAEVRYYATCIAGNLIDPRVLGKLIPRLFDSDQMTRQEAVRALKRFGNLPEFELALGMIRDTLAQDPGSLDAKRVAAVVAGELLDRESVPILARTLVGSDPVLAERCHRALVKITSHDFGFSERRWLSWWETHQSQHRIEWLIEALLNRHDLPRRAAAEDLARLTSRTMDLPANPTARQREEAYRAWRLWWETEGASSYSWGRGLTS